MKHDVAKLLFDNRVFARIAVTTGLLLLIPLTAMQLTSDVNWSPGDFVLMGTLLFLTASIFVISARRVDRKRWALVSFIVALGFFYVWAELAVGIFTNWGS